MSGGMGVDAMLANSVSGASGNDDLKREKEKRDTTHGRMDKHRELRKFSRDSEWNWSVLCGIKRVLCLCSENT